MDIVLNLNSVITKYQQQLADAELRANIAEVLSAQYREEIERLSNILITTTTEDQTSSEVTEESK